MLSAIVAVSKNKAIGRDGKLPWRLRDDLKNFKKLTMNKPMIMGRSTFESLGSPLPGRQHLVLSRGASDKQEHPQVKWFDSIDKLFAHTSQLPDLEIMIIGGEQIYRLFLPAIQRIYYTEVDCLVDGADAFFPTLSLSDWSKEDQFTQAKDNFNEHSWTFSILNRKTLA